jgi:hypothetical protein
MTPGRPGHNPGKESLERAYRRTRYRVNAWELDILIGQRHPELDRLLMEKGCAEWAFLSACNPDSLPLQRGENTRRTLLLQEQVQPWPYWAGQGIPMEPGWEPEDSFLIGGILLEEALAIARAFGQLALVVGTKGREASLVWC